mgnify:FL=1
MTHSHPARVELQQFLNDAPISRFQWGIFILCFLVALIDGYDTAAIGYIGPSLLAEWHIEKAALAPAMSAGLFGIALGAIFFGPVADRFGRKNILLISVLIFAIGTIISAYSTTLQFLEIMRFITGIGLGAAMPNAVTLFSEYCPSKRRFFLVNTMFCGFPVGVALGGFLASYLTPKFGWQSILFVGGIAPLFLLVLMLKKLPESARYLLHQAKNDQNNQNREEIQVKIQAKIQRIMTQIAPLPAPCKFYLDEPKKSSAKQGIATILSKHYIIGSILLWITYFMGLVIFYGVINWMPILFSDLNLSAGTAKIVTALFAVGGLGAIANGWLMDRYNPALLIMACTFLTALSVGLIGYSIRLELAFLVGITLFSGLVMNTAQSSLPSFAANFYPTEGRTTGVSWMLGIGRFGGIAGSYLVAALTSRNLCLLDIFLILALPALIGTIAMLVIYFRYYHKPLS